MGGPSLWSSYFSARDHFPKTSVHFSGSRSSLRDRKLEFLERRGGLGFDCRQLFRRGIRHHLFSQLRGDLVAMPNLIQWHAAVDRLAHQLVIVGDRTREGFAQRLLEVAVA